MAERRMFAKTIIDSDAFLDLPLSTQALYFHLNMRADDDGFVNNPRKIMRMIGSSDDELKILLAKRFIFDFDSGIVVIKHWKIHNYIQKDRYKPTVYAEEKALLSTKDNNGYTLYTECIQNGDAGKVRIGKDRLELEEDNILSTSEKIDYQEIINKYHLICRSLPRLRGLTDKRKKSIKVLLKTYTIEDLSELFDKTERSDFLTGRTGTWNGCGFDWLMKLSNAQKVIEGNYDNKQSINKKSKLEKHIDVAVEWLAESEK